MSAEVSLAVMTGVLGLLTAGILALFNSWISARAGIDENLRAERLELYRLFVSKWGVGVKGPVVEVAS